VACIQKIDVCIPTWNSGNTLDSCLRSVFREIPVNCIRILDKYSNDNTLEIAKKHGASVIQNDCGLGEARQRLMESVESEYFLFIDSDVVLGNGWFEKIEKVMKTDKKIGAICGFIFTDNPQDRHIAELFWKRAPNERTGSERMRMIGLNNCIIKTDAVRGIKIPSWLNNYEDRFIGNYIVSRGYRWVIVKDALCFHALGETSFWKTVRGRRYFGAGLRFWKDEDENASEKKIVARIIQEFVMSFPLAIRARDPVIIPYKAFSSLFTLLGYAGSSPALLDEINNDVGYKRQYSKFKRE
jgi:glycosyltransferase involved in cell wall biosynthesis